MNRKKFGPARTAIAGRKPCGADGRWDEGVETPCEARFVQYAGPARSLFLSEGDRIAVISPSSFPKRKNVDATLDGLRAWGYVPVEGRYASGEVRTLVEIVLPMSKPILATTALLSGLAYWNDWQNGLYYLVKRTDLYTIQNLLNRLIASMDFISNNASNSAITAGITIPSVGVRMAVAVIALIPVLIIYPFLQKGFVKGIVIGGVKG